jgi:hypothetical protein
MTSPPKSFRRVAPALAAASLVLAACGKSVEPTVIAPKVQQVVPAEVKKIPLRTPAAQVRAKLGKPNSIQHLVGNSKKTKNSKVRRIPYDLWIYGVKGGRPSDSVELTFVKGRLSSVLMSIATKATPNTNKAPGLP